MKRTAMSLALGICAMMTLGACASLGIPEAIPKAPVELADKTTLDESAALAVEFSYKAVRVAAEAMTDAGLIKGALATRFDKANDVAYAAVVASRLAYSAGNAKRYDDAIKDAKAAVAACLSILKGDSA